ncbi:hypothetical protein [Maridesulfovibrio sp.]|uniref:hypothetical protein n=1 Tax=Maridesulfovibrio sp. TaxID=2795000 RepID=UPI002AA7135C|nr:hypothetical protein [Maridesulfovibrio sp.]
MLTTLQRYTGWIILSTLFLFIASKLTASLILIVALLAWLVVIVEWNRLPSGSRRQASLLLGIGSIALLFSAWNGVFVGWQKILTQNLQLLPMFIAVSFLGLTTPDAQDLNLPKGKRAMLTTSVGTNLLGAVINLSILFVFGDRLKRNNTLSKAQAIILARSFCAAAWWSPFFLSAGVALTYAPQMEFQRILLPGIILTAISIAYSIIEVGFVRKIEFTGYPVRLESLSVPFLLAIAVIISHHYFPDLGMILLICIITPPAAILLMRDKPRLHYLHDFISCRITSTVSQFVLFLTAGIFSIGISSFMRVYPELFNFSGTTFSHSLFAMVSALLIALGFIGVHPLVGISIVSPLLLPLNPDNSQLAFLFLTTWAVAAGSSPLSAVGLVMSSRYQLSPWSILTNNLHYAVAMWLSANVVSILYFGSHV